MENCRAKNKKDNILVSWTPKKNLIGRAKVYAFKQILVAMKTMFTIIVTLLGNSASQGFIFVFSLNLWALACDDVK